MSTQHLNNIVKLFETCRDRHDLYTVFSDWCACAAISLSNAMDFQQREKREERYMEIISRYERDVVETFPKILGEVVMALEAAPQDILGSTFHALELHNTARGQFFTPYDLCRMMAKMTVGTAEDAQKTISERGFISAQEPAVGAGATIIALAEAIKDLGINYQQHLHVTAIDIDPRAVHMAYIQFSLMHIPAHVIVGDTLRMEFREDWFTPAHVMGFWSGKLAADRAIQRAQMPEKENRYVPASVPSRQLPMAPKTKRAPPIPAGPSLFDFM